jgi:hypothetical protein
VATALISLASSVVGGLLVFEQHLARMGQRIEELWQVYSGSEEEWQAARARLLEAIVAFNAAVRREDAALTEPRYGQSVRHPQSASRHAGVGSLTVQTPAASPVSSSG